MTDSEIRNYESANAILWEKRLLCWDARNQVGHDIICRAQQHITDAIKEHFAPPKVNVAAEQCNMSATQYRHAESLYLHGDLSGR